MILKFFVLFTLSYLNFQNCLIQKVFSIYYSYDIENLLYLYVVIWFLCFKKPEVLVPLLCKENENTSSAILICK